MRKFRRPSLCAFLAVSLGFTGFAASTTAGASTVSPGWRLAASYPPVANVRSVSCAPSAASATTFCLAVGDDGHNHPSIIATDDGGATWSSQPVSNGLLGLTTVACPLVNVCYASGSSGIIHSSNGGVTWSTQDPSFEAADIFCFTPAQCYAVGQLGMVATSDGSTWTSVALPSQVTGLDAITCPSLLNCYAVGVMNEIPGRHWRVQDWTMGITRFRKCLFSFRHWMHLGIDLCRCRYRSFGRERRFRDIRLWG